MSETNKLLALVEELWCLRREFAAEDVRLCKEIDREQTRLQQLGFDVRALNKGEKE